MARNRRQREAPPERRTAFRFPVNGPRSEGTLREGKSLFSVTVLDESAGGYAVTFVGPTQCRIGDQLELGVNDEWIPVRVAFVEMENVGVEQLTGGALQSRSRLGLERLPENFRHPGLRKQRFGTRFRRPLVMLRKNSLLLAAAGFLAGLALVGFSVMRKLDQSYALNPLKADDSEARVAHVPKSLDIVPHAKFAASKAAAKAASEAQGIVEAPPLTDYVSSRERVQPTTASAPEEPPRARQAVITRSAAPASSRKSLESMAAQKIEEAADDISHVLSSVDEKTLRLAEPEFLLRKDISQRLGLTHAQQAWLRRMVLEHRTSATEDSAAENHDEDLGINRRAFNKLTTRQRKLLLGLQHSQENSAN